MPKTYAFDHSALRSAPERIVRLELADESTVVVRLRRNHNGDYVWDILSDTGNDWTQHSEAGLSPSTTLRHWNNRSSADYGITPRSSNLFLAIAAYLHGVGIIVETEG